MDRESKQFWVITYSWGESQYIGKRIYEHAIHQGTIGEWLLMAVKQPEDWILINQVQITQEVYEILDGNVLIK